MGFLAWTHTLECDPIRTTTAVKAPMEPHVWVVSLWSRAHEWGPIRLHARGLDPIGTHRHEWVPFRALCTGQAPYGPIQTIGPIGTHAHSCALRQPSPTGGVPPAAPGHNRQGAPSPHALWCPPPEAAPGVPPLRDPHPLAWGNPVGSGGGGPYTSTHGAPTRGNPTLSPIAPSQEPPRGQSGGVGVGNGEKVGRGALGGGSGTPSSHQGDAGASLPGWQQRGPQQGHGDPRGVPRAAVGPREPTAGGATQEPPWGRGGHDGDTGAVTGTREPRPPRTRPPPSCPAWPRFGSGPPAQPPRSPPHSCPTASCVSPAAPH